MASPDLDEIFREALRFAEVMLKAHGEFIPFGVSMDASGAVAQVGADIGDEYPASAEVIDFLQSAFVSEAELRSIRAAGVCVNMRVVPPGSDAKTDAVCVRLAHVSGETAVVYVPYDLPESGDCVFGPMFRGSNVIFRLVPPVRLH